MRFFLFSFILFPLIGLAQISWNVDSVGSWRDIDLPLNNQFNTYNEVWGFAINGHEYAVIGSRAGTYIINVDAVTRPFLVQYFPGSFDDATNRDFHDYNGYLYMVADQGPSSLQIADLRDLPNSVSLVYDSDELFTRCHNIFIDTTTARLYTCDTEDAMSDWDVEIYDLSKGYIPELIASYDFKDAGGNDIDAFHDVWVEGDLAIGNNGRTGLFFFDVSDPENMSIINNITTYPEQGYNHAGYMDRSGQYYFFGDETKGTDLKVVNVSDLDDPEIVHLFNAGVNENDIVAHNLLVKDQWLYVSYYHEGLQIYDISNPELPEKVGHYQTYSKRIEGTKDKDYNEFRGAWGAYPYLPSGYVLVSDREKGLFIFDISKIDGVQRQRVFKPSDDMYVYPNPFNNELEIVFDANAIDKIELWNVEGKLIEDNLKFDVYRNNTKVYFDANLGGGIYFLRIYSGGEVIRQKLMHE